MFCCWSLGSLLGNTGFLAADVRSLRFFKWWQIIIIMRGHMIIRIFQNHPFISCFERPLSGENWFFTSIDLLCLVGSGFLSISGKKKKAGVCNAQQWLNWSRDLITFFSQLAGCILFLKWSEVVFLILLKNWINTPNLDPCTVPFALSWSCFHPKFGSGLCTGGSREYYTCFAQKRQESRRNYSSSALYISFIF